MIAFGAVGRTLNFSCILHLALSSKTKISDTNLVVLVKEYVLSFEISVKDALAVDGMQSKASLDEKSQHLGFRYGFVSTALVPQETLQVPVLTELHHDVYTRATYE